MKALAKEVKKYFCWIFQFSTKDWLTIIHRWLQSANTSLSAIASLVAIVAAICTAIIFLSEKKDNHFKDRDNKFVGIWTNPSEGCIDCDLGNDAERPIILELDVIDGKISGIMDASAWLSNYRKERDLNQKEPPKPKTKKQKEEKLIPDAARIALDMLHKNLLVEGTLTFNEGEITISDFVDGQRVLMGIADISLHNEVMRMEMKGKHFLGIPDKANMYRAYDEDGNICKAIDTETPWICLSKVTP